MSKRQKTASSSPAQKTKRQKTLLAQIGAPSDDDNRLPSGNNPSSSALSIRSVRQPSPPALTTLCIRAFSENFPEFSDQDHWASTRKWLEIVPEAVLPRLFAILKKQHPRLLSHAVITTYFLRGFSVSLNGDLGVTSHTLSAIPRVLGGKLRVLELSDFNKFTDKEYASMVGRLPQLETLVLRNCIKVGQLTVEAAAKTCPKLRIVNLSFTGANSSSIYSLIKACPDLEVLKMAGIRDLSDAMISTTYRAIEGESETSEEKIPLRRLRSLKLRHNDVSDASVSFFLQNCPALERIDVSFTRLKSMSNLPIGPRVEKLSLTSTFISSEGLIESVRHLPLLKILNIGAMGARPGSSTSIMNSTSMTLTDNALQLLTDALRSCPALETINLVQNLKLGMTKRHDSALAYFIRHVGRRCQHLNLSGISLRSGDLVGLVAESEEVRASPLKTLILNKTLIDDDVAPWISSCGDLEVLEVAETRISAEGLFPIIDSCHCLSSLNLTGCRGVKIADRRRFFEVWKEERRETPSA
ncbi:hypothetical protein M0805_003252 [Coniferiporia weirii]|nr:hypothetical protein M0805_003252 [Coniferiporia weirii]